MTAPASTALRIGEVARRVGTTPRTIRYYEEIGLLPAPADRPAGGHRVYEEADVERLREALRLKALLGVSLDDLRVLLEAEEARAARHDEWHHGQPSRARRREILSQSLEHAEHLRGLVQRRAAELAELDAELVERQQRLHVLLDELDGTPERA